MYDGEPASPDTSGPTCAGLANLGTACADAVASCFCDSAGIRTLACREPRDDRDRGKVIAPVTATRVITPSPSTGEGSARAGRNRSLERASPAAATGSWEAASDVGLELRPNVWLQSVASVPTLRRELSRSGRPRASPSHRDFPRSGSWTVLFRRPVASAIPLSAADRQHLGDRRCPRPSTRCSRTLL